MKKVLFISRSIEPPWDEASRNLVRSIALNLKGYDFHIMTGVRGSSIEKENVFEEKVYTRRPLSLSQKVRLGLALFSMRKKFDIYHFCFTPEKLVSLYIRSIMPADRLKVQTIPFIPDSSALNPRKIIFGDIITVFSQTTKERLQGCGIKDVRVVYPSVDMEVFMPQEKQGNAVKIFYAGYIANSKVLHDIYAIAEAVLRQGQGMEFVFAIRVKDKRELTLKKYLRKSLSSKFAGRFSFVEDPGDFIPAMRGCDIFIYPFLSRFERKIDIPFVIAEAMACAKPVLVSDASFLNEPFIHGGGVLTGAKTPRDFAGKILELCSDNALLRRIGLQNRETALSLFDSRKNFSKIRAIYDGESSG